MPGAFALTALTFLLSMMDVAVGAERAPRFADYLAGAPYQGKAAKPKFTTPGSSAYRTRLRDVVSRDDKPNFAGRYFVAICGCGSACASGGIIDAATGNVIMIPFTISGWRDTHDTFEAIHFRPHSRLIGFSGERNEKGDMGQHFYV